MVHLFHMGFKRNRTKDEFDARIVRTINRLRADHRACTLRAVADDMGVPLSTLDHRMRELRNAGIVTSTGMPGSLRVCDGVQVRGHAIWQEVELPFG